MGRSYYVWPIPATGCLRIFSGRCLNRLLRQITPRTEWGWDWQSVVKLSMTMMGSLPLKRRTDTEVLLSWNFQQIHPSHVRDFCSESAAPGNNVIRRGEIPLNGMTPVPHDTANIMMTSADRAISSQALRTVHSIHLVRNRINPAWSASDSLVTTNHNIPYSKSVTFKH
jgi:hypothetical protein